MILIATPLYKPHTVRAVAHDLKYSYDEIEEFVKSCYVPEDVAEAVEAFENIYLGDDISSD